MSRHTNTHPAEEADAAMATEAGFSLPDILVGLAIVGMLTLAAMRSLIGIVEVASEGDRAADRRQDIERVADLISLDVARAETVADDLAVTGYPTELGLVLDDGTDSRVIWRRLGSGDLIREEWAGSVVTTKALVLDGTAEPLFTYHDGGGNILDPSTDGPIAVGRCTVRVRVTLATVRDGPQTRTSATVDAPILRRAPVPDPCP